MIFFFQFKHLFIVDWETSYYNLYSSVSTLRVQVLPFSGISLLYFEIYKGVFYIQEILLSLTRVSHLSSLSNGLAAFLKIILANGVKGELKILKSLKFSPQNRDRNQEPLCLQSDAVTTTTQLSYFFFFKFGRFSKHSFPFSNFSSSIIQNFKMHIYFSIT